MLDVDGEVVSQIGFVESLLSGLETTTKKSLTEVFRHLVPNAQFGPVDHQEKALNFQAYYLNSTTPSSSNTEFSIPHGLGRTPYLVLPVLALDQVGAQIIPLTMSRAADSQRVYFTSPSTSAAFSILVE